MFFIYFQLSISCVDNQKLSNNSCQSNCGDGYRQQLEECDNGELNSINFGCLNCQCIPGYQSQAGICFPICGDGILTTEEECDDGNILSLDGCSSDCLIDCLNCNPQSCLQRSCTLCNSGYYFDQEFQCKITKCGDGIKVQNEQCDDGNEIQNDGCFNCQCELWEQNSSKYGQEVSNKDCINLQSQCPQNCQVCNKGVCLECQSGYYLISYENICESICGDGITQKEEQCDDDNVINSDGCSKKCKIESNYICRNSKISQSECTFSVQPKMILNFLDKRNSFQYYLITFTEKMKIDKDYDFIYSIVVIMDSFDSKQYLAQLNAVQSVKKELSEVIYKITINFYTKVDDFQYLKVRLTEKIYNEDKNELNNYEQSIKLKPYYYPNQAEVDRATELKKSNQVFIGSIGMFAILALILGNQFLFATLTEILQLQTYLRFINLEFPFNVNLYFEANDILQIDPILSYLKLSDLSTIVIGTNFEESKGKLKYYEVNSDLLSNLQGQFAQIVFLMLTFLMCHAAFRLIHKILRLFPVRFVLKSQKLFIFVNKNCYNFIQDFNASSFLMIIQVNVWDLLFSSINQIQSNIWIISPRQIFNNFSALSIIFGYSYFFFFQFFQTKMFQRKYKNFWQQKQAGLITLKKLLFAIILVCLQCNAELQTLLLSLISLLFLVYTFKANANTDILEFIHLILLEGGIFFFLLSSFLYIQDFSYPFNRKTQVMLGWCQISLLLSALLTKLIAQLKDSMVYFKNKLCKHQQHVQGSIPFPISIPENELRL